MYSTLQVLPSAFTNAPEYPSKTDKLFISWSCAWELCKPQIVCNKLCRVHLTDPKFVKSLCRCYIPHTEEVVLLLDMFWHPSGWLQDSTWPSNLLCIHIDRSCIGPNFRTPKTCPPAPFNLHFGKGQDIETILLCILFWSTQFYHLLIYLQCWKFTLSSSFFFM